MNRLAAATAAVLTILAAPSSVYAQGGGASATGTISGRVADSAGGVLPGVTVTLTGPALIGSQTTTTNDAGLYRFPAVSPGRYTLQYALPGFGTLKREGIEVSIGFTATVNVELSLASLAETLTVSGEAPIVDTSASRVQQNFKLAQLEAIPNARDMWGLLALTPSVTMTRIDVQPKLLEWARTRAMLTVQDLLPRFPKLTEWEKGEVRPTLRQLEQFAKATHVPFGYLLLQEPPEEQLPVPVYRTLTTLGVQRPSPGLLQTVQTLQRRQAWMREHLTEDDEQPLAFVGSAKLEHSIEAVANHIRTELGLTIGWAQQLPTWTDALRRFREAAESAGIVVTANGVVGNTSNLDVANIAIEQLSVHARYLDLLACNI